MDVFLRWPLSSQDAALGWSRREGEKCSSCGVHPDDLPGVHAHLRQCEGCGHRERAEDLAQAERGRGEKGVYVQMVPVPVTECVRCSRRDE